MIVRRDAIYRKLINTARWRRLRAQVLARDAHLCQDCLLKHRATRATEVHHIEPVDWAATEDGKTRRMFDTNNLVSLCHQCHSARHLLLMSCNAEARKERQIERALKLAEELARPSVKK